MAGGTQRRTIDTLPTWAYKALIVVATMIWGASFITMKDIVGVMEPAWLLGIRFTLAGLILLAILHRRVGQELCLRTLGAGMLLGAFDFTAFLAQTVGLAHTTPGINAFLTATYCVIVPFVWWLVARRRPTVYNVGAALLAVAGIWLVAVGDAGKGLSIGFGEAMTLVGAVAFAVHIVFTSKFSRFADALVLTVFQFLTEGTLGLVVGVLTEPAPSLATFTPGVVGGFAVLIRFASIFAFGAQNLALAHVPPTQASLLLSLESVFGVLFSVALYGERVTPRLLAGFALIFVAITASETLPLKRRDGAGGDGGGSDAGA